MNEELQKALGELLSKANNGIDAASGFLVAELPEVIQQLLMWSAVSLSVRVFIFAILSVVAFKAGSYSLAKKIEAGRYSEWIVGVIFSSIAFCIFITISIVCFFGALKIYIAPKVWLLEYAANLTK